MLTSVRPLLCCRSACYCQIGGDGIQWHQPQPLPRSLHLHHGQYRTSSSRVPFADNRRLAAGLWNMGERADDRYLYNEKVVATVTHQRRRRNQSIPKCKYPTWRSETKKLSGPSVASIFHPPGVNNTHPPHIIFQLRHAASVLQLRDPRGSQRQRDLRLRGDLGG